MEWQPIETAPKDGTKFMAYHPLKIFGGGHSIQVMKWLKGQLVYTLDHDSPTVLPTHWMPLPEPPVTP